VEHADLEAGSVLGPTILNTSAFEERTQHFFGFEELAGDFAGSQGVAGVVGVDLLYGFGDFAAEQRTLTGWNKYCSVPCAP
jgi:hypothetical protein